MEDFNLKGYLKENKLIKEEVYVDFEDDLSEVTVYGFGQQFTGVETNDGKYYFIHYFDDVDGDDSVPFLFDYLEKIGGKMEIDEEEITIEVDYDDLRPLINESKLLKEFTVPGGDYSNSYGNNQAEEQLTSPEDYEIFIKLFPQGEASRILMDPKRKELYDQHLEWTKDSQYNNTFEHMQYHIINHDGETYKAHQTQYYNSNYKDFRNPRFTELMISKDGKRMGTYLVDTKEYIKDLNDLENQGKLGTRVSENKSLQENRLEGLIKEKLCKKGEAYRKRRMAAGEKSSAYLSGRAVKVCKGQMSGKKKKKTNEVEDRVSESLRDWFKKEDWVRIDTQGNISGKCGTMKNKKVPSRCLPRKKAQSLTKAERKASAQKKKREGKKGKQFVKNPK